MPRGVPFRVKPLPPELKAELEEFKRRVRLWLSEPSESRCSLAEANLTRSLELSKPKRNSRSEGSE